MPRRGRLAKILWRGVKEPARLNADQGQNISRILLVPGPILPMVRPMSAKHWRCLGLWRCAQFCHRGLTRPILRPMDRMWPVFQRAFGRLSCRQIGADPLLLGKNSPLTVLRQQILKGRQSQLQPVQNTGDIAGNGAI